MISSPDNARVKEVVSLRSSGERRRRGLFVAEGPREVERAAAAGLRVLETFYAPALLDWPGAEAVSERVLAKMAYRAKPEGVVALVEAPRFGLPLGGTLYLVAVGIEKPGNLGAIARSAEAAGADALVVADGQADPFNPNAIRASTGAVFSLPVVEASLEQVVALGVALVAAVVGAATACSDADLVRPVRDRGRLREPRPAAPLARVGRARGLDPARGGWDDREASTPPWPPRSCSSRRCGSVPSRDDVLRARPVVERYLQRTPLLELPQRWARASEVRALPAHGLLQVARGDRKTREPRGARTRPRRDHDLGRKPRPGGRLRRRRARRRRARRDVERRASALKVAATRSYGAVVDLESDGPKRRRSNGWTS